jgi:hypothetical protein
MGLQLTSMKTLLSLHRHQLLQELQPLHPLQELQLPHLLNRQSMFLKSDTIRMQNRLILTSM